MIPCDIGDFCAVGRPCGLHVEIIAPRQFLRPKLAFTIHQCQNILVFVSMNENNPFAIWGYCRRGCSTEFRANGFGNSSAERQVIEPATIDKIDYSVMDCELRATIENAACGRKTTVREVAQALVA